jgi:thiol-disulfide isomerase/thioredoxin
MIAGAVASLILAIALRNDIAPLPATQDLSPKPAPAHLSPRTATIAGLTLVAVVAATAVRDGAQLARGWSTLAPLGPGEPLPALTVPLLDGGSLSLAALPARPHLLVFWTTWCGVCRTEMPMLRALHTRYGERGLQILLVNADDSPDQAALAAVYRDHNLLTDLPVALDAGPLRRALRVRVYPHLVLVDAAGQPVLTHQGAIGERTLASAIEAVLPR